MGRVLLVIDVQNDYFAGGRFPLWDVEATLGRVEAAIALAKSAAIPVVHVQHVADPASGPAPFFERGTAGAEIHPRVTAAAPDSPVVVKSFADSFHETNLDAVLVDLGATELLLCGMMTQNCVTHTAVSKSADKYAVRVLPDCCTTVSKAVHLIALHGLSTRAAIVPSADALKP